MKNNEKPKSNILSGERAGSIKRPFPRTHIFYALSIRAGERAGSTFWPFLSVFGPLGRHPQKVARGEKMRTSLAESHLSNRCATAVTLCNMRARNRSPPSKRKKTKEERSRNKENPCGTVSVKTHQCHKGTVADNVILSMY